MIGNIVEIQWLGPNREAMRTSGQDTLCPHKEVISQIQWLRPCGQADIPTVGASGVRMRLAPPSGAGR
jgi:hypothetical protein